jgi:predicted RNA-binding protein with PUA-like domain
MNFWLIKSEPFKYSWEQFNKDQSTFWDGVRNYQARNNLMAMELGDLCLYYQPAYQLKKPVSLQTMKSDPRLTQMGLLRQPRLSVIALSKDEFDTVILLSNEPT